MREGGRHGYRLTSIPTAARQKAKADTGQRTLLRGPSPQGPPPALTFPRLKRLRGVGGRGGGEDGWLLFLLPVLKSAPPQDEGRGGPPGGRGPQEAPRKPHPRPGAIRPPGALSVPSSAETPCSAGLGMESPTWPRSREAGERQGELSFCLSLVSSHLLPPQDSQDFGWEHSDGIGLSFSKS